MGEKKKTAAYLSQSAKSSRLEVKVLEWSKVVKELPECLLCTAAKLLARVWALYI